ncbi:putative transposase [Escherichia coli LT-68]|nr:putative transposase [Escherichia coli LT-68]
MRAEIALMSGSAFAVTHHAFSSGAGRTSDGNGSHASTLKSPSYTKSVSWQHYPIREGYAGYRQLKAKTGMSDAKCRNLVNAYQIPTDTHEFMTPDGLLSRRAIVAVEPFMAAFYRVMEEAEPRGTRWYHPKMGLFQVIGWQK